MHVSGRSMIQKAEYHGLANPEKAALECYSFIPSDDHYGTRMTIVEHRKEVTKISNRVYYSNIVAV
jgi:hypothetical protein